MRESYLYSEIEKKTIEEKLDLIERIENDNKANKTNFKILELLSSDKDDEIRSRVAESLINFQFKESEEILKRLLNDDAELVRVNACDSLYFSKDLEVNEILKTKLVKDRSSLVRGYATLSLVDISKNLDLTYKEDLYNFLITSLKKEKVKWVKINIYKALYLLGDESYLNQLMHKVDNRYYRNRCAVVNVLGDILTNNNSNIIKERLVKRKKVEKSIAVSSSIDKVLKRINKL